MGQKFYLSSHAITRTAQRNIKNNDIEYVLENGQRVYTGGALHVFLGKKDIPKEDHKRNRAHQLVGTIVLMDAKSGAVITVYRNRKGLPAIRKKSKYLVTNGTLNRNITLFKIHRN